MKDGTASSGSVDYGGLLARDDCRAFERLHKRHSLNLELSNCNDMIPGARILTSNESNIFFCKLTFLTKGISPFNKSGGNFRN